MFVAWTDNRSGTDVYAQRLDAAGVALWDAGGLAVCAGSGAHAFPSAVPDGTGAAIVAWEDTRNGASDVYAQRLEPGGSTTWAIGGTPVSTAGGNQYQVSAASTGDGAAIMLWMLFYAGGALLVKIPPDFHDGTIWKRIVERP